MKLEPHLDESGDLCRVWFKRSGVAPTQLDFRPFDVWQPKGWGAEAWPGPLFDFEQSACVAYDGLEDV